MRKKWLQKQILLPILFVLIGVLLLLFGSNVTKKEKNESTALTAQELERFLEQELSAFLEGVDGIDGVQVFLTLESSAETVYHTQTATSGKQEYLLITQNGKTEPLVQKEIYATVRGVAVLCRGGDLPQNQQKVIGLLSCAFHIPENRIFVAEGKKLA